MSKSLKRRRESSEHGSTTSVEPDSDQDFKMPSSRRARNTVPSTPVGASTRRASKRLRKEDPDQDANITTVTTETRGRRTRGGKSINYAEPSDYEEESEAASEQQDSESGEDDEGNEQAEADDSDDNNEENEEKGDIEDKEDELTQAEPTLSRLQEKKVVKLTIPRVALERIKSNVHASTPRVTSVKRPAKSDLPVDNSPPPRRTRLSRKTQVGDDDSSASESALAENGKDDSDRNEDDEGEEEGNKNVGGRDEDEDDDDDELVAAPTWRSRRLAAKRVVVPESDPEQAGGEEENGSDSSDDVRPVRSNRKRPARPSAPPPPPRPKPVRKRRTDDSDSDAVIDEDEEDEDEEEEEEEEEEDGIQVLESESSGDEGFIDDSPRSSRRARRRNSKPTARSTRNSSSRRARLEPESDSDPEVINPPRRGARATRAMENMRRTNDGLRRMHSQRVKQRPDYRLIRPELNSVFEEPPSPKSDNATSKSKGGGAGFRDFLFGMAGNLNERIGGGGGGGGSGDNHAVGHDSDSSDDGLALGAVGQPPPMPMAGGGGHGALAGAAPTSASLGQIKDRQALADSDPLGVDTNVTFDGVGGLDDHINQLKEMVLLPLLYPEVFQQFKITPPRGVLFHGPPGTGKTLLARALAASVSSQGKKVTFYMRKGADALSKWVGEAERQLRLLFEDARKNQPSIIFFDEIDGLAPVRSSKQEQIHASIVATILALMDGMDGRGQVIVIGATNRPDNVDPALRRPGRFDREFYFPLPNKEGRRAILDIHTKGWEPPLEAEFKDQLAELTKGYGGADLRALCTEAALNAVQGTFPQIYQSNAKLRINPSEIRVLARDFMASVNKLVPSSARSTGSLSAPLADDVKPLLNVRLSDLTDKVERFLAPRKKTTALEEAQYVRDDSVRGFELELMDRRMHDSRVFRPRILIRGREGMGQAMLAAALFYKFENIHVQHFGLASVMADSSRSPDTAVVQMFSEARQRQPSVIYIPDVDQWLETLPTSAVRTFIGLLKSLPPSEGVMVVGTVEEDDDTAEWEGLKELRQIFGSGPLAEVPLPLPTDQERRAFFKPLIEYIGMAPDKFPDRERRRKRKIVELEVVPEEEQPGGGTSGTGGGAGVGGGLRTLSEGERRAWEKQKRVALSHLRLVMQPVMANIRNKFKKLRVPVIPDSAVRYLFDAPPAPPPAPLLTTNIVNPNANVEVQLLSAPAEVDATRKSNSPENRPFELASDADGVPGLREVRTGKFYYNIDLVLIERRLGSGEYLRPAEFLADAERLVADAVQLGEPDRLAKAREMLDNVNVDINYVEAQNANLWNEWEEIYQRETQERLAREKEKARERGREREKEKERERERELELERERERERQKAAMIDSRETDVMMVDSGRSLSRPFGGSFVPAAGAPVQPHLYPHSQSLPPHQLQHHHYQQQQHRSSMTPHRPILMSNAIHPSATPDFASVGPSMLASCPSLPDTQESVFDSPARVGNVTGMSVSVGSTPGPMAVDVRVQIQTPQQQQHLAQRPPVGGFGYDCAFPQPQQPSQHLHHRQPISLSPANGQLAPVPGNIVGFDPAYVHVPPHGGPGYPHGGVVANGPASGPPAFFPSTPAAMPEPHVLRNGSLSNPDSYSHSRSHSHFNSPLPNGSPSVGENSTHPSLPLTTRADSKAGSMAGSKSQSVTAEAETTNAVASGNTVRPTAPGQENSEAEEQEQDHHQHPPYNLTQSKLEDLHTLLTLETNAKTVEQLQSLNSRLIRLVWASRTEWDRDLVVEKVREAWQVMDTEEDTYQF